MVPVTIARGTHPEITKKSSRKQQFFTSHPDWLREVMKEIEPYQRAVQECRLITQVSRGKLSLSQVNGCLIQIYPFVEAFPQWLALNITKATDAASREVLIDNVRVEKWHAQQWVQMSEGFGVSRDELFNTPILPKVEALTHYMWSVNLRGTIAESMSAMSYAIEGATQGIARAVLEGFSYYEKQEGIALTKKASAWMRNHARYDESHPLEALEIIKRHASCESDRSSIANAAKRSLEYLLIALDECYLAYDPHAPLVPSPVAAAA